MGEIRYTDHLELRLKLRDIARRLPLVIFKKAREHYLDSETGKMIAVAAAKYKDKVRDFAVIYEEDENQNIMLITIHPLKKYQKFSRIISGRWREL